MWERENSSESVHGCTKKIIQQNISFNLHNLFKRNYVGIVIT